MLKLQEIDKLKYVLLNPLQLSLFNLLDKPLIHCEDEFDDEDNLHLTLSNLIMEKISDSEKKMFEIYKLLAKSEIKSKVDRRLLKLVEDQINLIDF